jgi:hypothetical protein
VQVNSNIVKLLNVNETLQESGTIEKGLKLWEFSSGKVVS